MDLNQPKKKNPPNEWIEIIKRYNKPDPIKSWWQIINSVGPYIILWIVMIKTIEICFNQICQTSRKVNSVCGASNLIIDSF